MLLCLDCGGADRGCLGLHGRCGICLLPLQLQGLQKSMADDGWNKAGPLRLDNISKHDQVDIETLRAELKKVRAKAAEVWAETLLRTHAAPSGALCLKASVSAVWFG